MKRIKHFIKSIYFSFFLKDPEGREKLKMIYDSGLFDLDYYNKQLKVPFLTMVGAITHYLTKGYKLFYNPNPYFNTRYYLETYPDIGMNNTIPFFHYLNVGYKEDRNPSVEFNTKLYRSLHEEVEDNDLNPLYHFLHLKPKDERGARKNAGLTKFSGTKDENIRELIAKRDLKSDSKPGLASDDTYFEYLNQANQKEVYEKDYVKFEEHAPVETDLRLIAFYLPQFHPIPENDKAWGKGFTEWTNVSKALPQFENHYQPRLPGELGHYDLRLIDVQRRQIELAKNYGLHGFCYHYYWFGGTKVIDKPLKQILDNPDLDFPFCINWANENWTKRWDGLDREVILKQSHSPEDDIAFLEDIRPILLDKRYIRINGKPLLMIYRPQLFPNISETIKRWRKHAQKIGLGELYLVLTHSFEAVDPSKIGFDAATEFAPNNYLATEITQEVNLFNTHYRGKVFDYKSAINHSISYSEPEFVKFRGVCPSWDNEARKPGKGTVFQNSSPENYRKWLEYICYYTEENRKLDEKIVLINAWNEWGEAAYLEPDRKFGYAYLEATYNLIKKFDRKKIQFLKSTQTIRKDSNVAVVLHLFYMDVWDEIRKELENFTEPFDLYVDVINTASLADLQRIKKDVPSARIFVFENRGRDILPFLKVLNLILPLQYKYICKIHSKKSLHRGDGDKWRNHLIQSIMGSKERIEASKKALDKDAGIVVAKGNRFSYKDWIGSNSDMVDQFGAKAGLEVPEDFMFPAGSIFWCRPDIFIKMVKFMKESDFVLEDGQLDGTIAHACERIVGLLCTEFKLKIEEI